MKPVFTLLFVCCLLALPAAAQNYVWNSSFERIIKCPSGPTLFSGYCWGWTNYTQGTPDYLNACPGVGWQVSVPNNFVGSQPAAEGKAYAGICYYPNPDRVEYFMGQMTPLVPGRSYEVSMFVSLADGVKLATDCLGVYFRRGAGSIVPHNKSLAQKPHVSYKHYGAITDSKNWVQLIDTFVADSAYDHLVIGFFTDTLKMAPVTPTMPISVGADGAYYYIDSVTVRYYGPPDPPPPPPPPPVLPATAAIGNMDTVYCTGSPFSLPFKVTNRRFDSTNRFIVRLQSTDSSVIVLLPPYKTDTSAVISWNIPDSLRPGTYKLWLISTARADTFYYTPNIHVYDYPDLELSVNDPDCFTNIELLARTSPQADVTWNGPNNFFPMGKQHTIPNASTEHSGTYFATAVLGPCAVRDSVVVALDCGDIQVPSAFSPNRDGKNDMLHFYGISNVRELSFTVYNRWGQVIYHTTDPKSGWDGSYKNATLHSEIVAYVLKAVRKDGSIVNRAGNITVIR